jgi:hypothetical protein
MNAFSQSVSLLLTYLISFAWDRPNVNKKLLKTVTVTIQNLIRSSWPNTSRIFDMQIVKRGTLQEVVFNHIMKPLTANSPDEMLIECEKCICICDCMIICPVIIIFYYLFLRLLFQKKKKKRSEISKKNYLNHNFFIILFKMAHLSLKYDNKGLFSSKSYHQSIFTASFQHPSLESLLCNLEIIFRIFSRLGKVK